MWYSSAIYLSTYIINVGPSWKCFKKLAHYISIHFAEVMIGWSIIWWYLHALPKSVCIKSGKFSKSLQNVHHFDPAPLLRICLKEIVKTTKLFFAQIELSQHYLKE